MKRIFPLALICVLLVFSLVPFASASEVDDGSGFVEVLDFCMPNGTTSTRVYVRGAGATATFNMGQARNIAYVDVIFTVPDGTTVQAPTIRTSSTATLNFIPIAGNTYRAWGEVNSISSSFTLTFLLTGGSWVNLDSVRVSYNPYQGFDERATCRISTSDHTDTINYVPTDIINYRSWVAGTDPESKWMHLNIQCASWQKYDFIDFTLSLQVSGVTSVMAGCGDSAVPCTLSFLDNTGAINNDYVLLIRLDLRNVDRNSTEALRVEIFAEENIGSYNFVSMEGCRGFVAIEPPSVFSIMGNKIIGLLSDIASAFGVEEPAVSHEGIVDGLAQDVSKGTSALNKMEKPDLDSALGNVNMDVTDDGLMLVNTVFTNTLNDQYLGFIFLLVATLGLISYLLYGRG